jgi:SanA protein
MMIDRMDTALRLYQQGGVRTLYLSGYSEHVSLMVDYAQAHGVPGEDLVADPAGSDTYHTMKNAKDLIGMQTAIISTQRFHLYRALYLARSMGIEAVGLPADAQDYPGTWFGRTVREWGARVKAFVQVSLSETPLQRNERTWSPLTLYPLLPAVARS